MAVSRTEPSIYKLHALPLLLLHSEVKYLNVLGHWVISALFLCVLYCLFHYPQSVSPYPGCCNSCTSAMREVKVVVVEVLGVLIKQTVKSFGGPIEAWSWNGKQLQALYFLMNLSGP
ncbi:hypothetical protein ILYODFUR_022710 [Ilyodon furcidens]|uniref:Uncharacterized protein n=1 Tax=Ilyodon furcidens TaxID=33524 RepID=A0ABV0U116_9TELE